MYRIGDVSTEELKWDQFAAALQTQTLYSLQEISVSQFPQGKTCFYYRDFPVIPCTSLYGIAVC